MSKYSTPSNSSTIDRINACLRACEGVDDPQEGELELLRARLARAYSMVTTWAGEYAALRSQRDELVAAMEKALRCWAWEANQGDGIDVDNYPAYLEARAALARAKGGTDEP